MKCIRDDRNRSEPNVVEQMQENAYSSGGALLRSDPKMLLRSKAKPEPVLPIPNAGSDGDMESIRWRCRGTLHVIDAFRETEKVLDEMLSCRE